MVANRPAKPYETFPLFAHAKGYWAKKIKGKQVTFGPWVWPDRAGFEQSWKAALRAFQVYDEKRALARGRVDRPDRLTVKEVVDAYLINVNARWARNELSPRQVGDCITHLKPFVDFVGGAMRVGELEAQPQLLQKFLNSRSEDRWHSFNRHVAILSSCFAWAEHPIDGILKRPFALRPMLRKRSAKLLRRAKRQQEADKGKHRWTPVELAALFRTAPTTILSGWLHLGYFCAYGNSDIADLPRNAINFAPPASAALPIGSGTIHFPRPKTEIERAAVIPPRVATALQQCMTIRRPAAEARFKSLLFLTRFGMPYVREVIETDESGQVAKVMAIDQVSNQFTKFRDRVFHCPCGHAAALDGDGTHCTSCRQALRRIRSLGFYTFRHTAITYASGVADVDTLHRWRGHSLAGMSNTYVEEIESHKLAKIAEHLLQRLNDAMNPTNPTDPTNPALTPRTAGTPAATATALSPAA